MIGVGLRDPRRHRADPHFGDQLDADPGLGIGVLEVVDQLRQVLDRVDVVVWRRRNQADPGGRMAHPGDGLVDLVAGQLTALAGLGALRHLDLQSVRIGQVFGGDAEAARGHLLDRRALGIAVLHGAVPFRLLAALAGVRLAAYPVHGHRQRGMRLVGNRAERHGAGGEPLDDVFHRLHFVERQRIFGELEIEQSPQVIQGLGLIVDHGGEGAELVHVAGAYRVMERRYGLRRPNVVFAADAVGQIATHVEGAPVDGVGAVGLAVAPRRFTGHLGEADAADRRLGLGEVLVDERRAEADGVEDLRAAIGLEGGNAHLRHHLEDALVHRLDVVGVGGGLVQGVRQAGQQGRDGLEGQVRVDRLGAVAGEQAEIVDLARLAGLHHQADLGAQPLADQMMVHRRRRQQRRDGDVVRIHPAIRENQNVVTLAHQFLGPGADPVEGRFHARRTHVRRVTHVERIGAEGLLHLLVDVADLFQVDVAEDGLHHLEAHVRPPGVEPQQVGPGTDQRDQRHHQFLADGIDGRIGDLGEALLEVVVEHLRPLREHRLGGVAAHGPHRVLPAHRHRPEEELEVLLGVAESLLAVEQGLRVGPHGRHLGRQVVDLDLGSR